MTHPSTGTLPAASKPAVVVGVLATAGIVAALTQTLVVPLLGGLPQLLHTTASNASWVVTATLLAAAVCTPVAGRLGDLFGKRRMLLVCTVPIITGSAVCALSSSLAPMIVGRGLQGAGMGIVPLGISALRDALPPQRLGSAIALMSSSMGIGGALGLPLAAVVAQNTSWHVLFWGTAVLSLLSAVLIRVFVPAVPAARTGGRFDVAGALGLGVGLVGLLLGVSKGPDWGWGSGTTLGMLLGALVVLAVWGRWELRSRDPLVDLRVTARPQVLLTNAASVVVGFAMYASQLLLPQLMQLPTDTGYGLGQSMVAMGLWMAPQGFMMMAVSHTGARMSARFGARVTLSVGSAVIAASYAAAIFLMGSTWGVLAAACITGAGTGLAYGAMPALIMSAVPATETASANSFNTLMRSVGTSVSAAVIGVVLSHLTVQAHGAAVPTETGFHVGLLIGCGVALLAAAVALTIPRARRLPQEAAVPSSARTPQPLSSSRSLPAHPVSITEQQF